MNMLKRIMSAVSVIVMVAGCAVFLLFHVSATGWKALSVPTGSMRPNMPPGSLVLVHSVPVSSLKVGDVITYINPRNGKTTITHRIIKTYMIGGRIPGFVTEGDANKLPDEPIAAGSVIGRAVWHAPHIGTWLISSKSWLSISLLVYVPAILLTIEEVQRLSEYWRKMQPYILREWEAQKPQKTIGVMRKYAAGAGLSCLAVLVSTVFIGHALAAIQSNTVTLAGNHIMVSTARGGGECAGNTNNNSTVNINNSTTQSASSGSATVSGNTTGGNAASGSAGNTNSTTVTINITNC